MEEEATWKTKTPEKTGTEQEKRMAAIEKTQEEQSTLVTTLTAALEKNRMECGKVLTKANIAIEDSNRAVNALMKHLTTLDEEIEKFEKIVASNVNASKYLEAQVKAIASHLAKLTNAPQKEMEAIQKLLAETAAKMAVHDEEAKANTAELVEVRIRRLKAGLDSKQAKARMMTHKDGRSIQAILQEPSEDQEMEDARGKRVREESGEAHEHEPLAKRGSSPPVGKQEEQKKMKTMNQVTHTRMAKATAMV